MPEDGKAFLEVCGYLPPQLRQTLERLPERVQAQLHEIRLRAGRPVCLFDGRASLVLCRDGSVSEQAARAYLLSRTELEETFRAVCEYSVHSFQEEIRQGFVTLRGGHRAGLCGTCLMDQGRVVGVREISSLNLRIAREKPGCAGELARRLFGRGLCSALLVGQAGSGKTTLLRDLIRQLSDGLCGTAYKVAAVDERGELAAMWHGVSQHHLGRNTDVYHLYPKHIGMSMAVRTLSPQVVACDEIGTEDDLDALVQSMNAGAAVLATVHGAGLEEIRRRGRLSRLLRAGVFDHAVILSGSGAPGSVREILPLKEGVG